MVLVNSYGSPLVTDYGAEQCRSVQKVELEGLIKAVYVLDLLVFSE